MSSHQYGVLSYERAMSLTKDSSPTTFGELALGSVYILVSKDNDRWYKVYQMYKKISNDAFFDENGKDYVIPHGRSICLTSMSELDEPYSMPVYLVTPSI